MRPSTQHSMFVVAVALTVIAVNVDWSAAGATLSRWSADVGGLRLGQVASDAGRALVYGTNMALYDSEDQVVQSKETQGLLKRAGVPIIRMPVRSARGDIDDVRALRTIQYIGAIPLVIVHGPEDAQVLSDDRSLIQLVRNVFGAGRAYVEFGNEPDLAGVDAEQYAASWNAVVPTLKEMAASYSFIGPSTSVADPAYISKFDRLATPRPDADSWHEYACTPAQSNGECMTNLASWTEHVTRIDHAVRTSIGGGLPLLITEWNLDAVPDPRTADPGFMRLWTGRALQTLGSSRAKGLYAALQYCVAGNSKFNLVAPDNSLTPEGRVFFGMLTAARSGGDAAS